MPHSRWLRNRSRKSDTKSKKNKPREIGALNFLLFLGVLIELYRRNAVDFHNLKADDGAHRGPGQIGIVALEVFEVVVVEPPVVPRSFFRALLQTHKRLLDGVIGDSDEDVQAVLALADGDLALLEIVRFGPILAHCECLASIQR